MKSASMLKSNASALVLLLASSATTLAAQTSDPQDLMAEIKGLSSRFQIVDNKVKDVLAFEIKVLRDRARQRATDWREDGIAEDAMAEYGDLRQQLHTMHLALKADYSKVHDLFKILRRRIDTLDVVYTGSEQNKRFPNLVEIDVEFEVKEIRDSLLAVYLTAMASDTAEQGYEELKTFAGIIETIANANRALMESEEDKLRIQQWKLIFDVIPIVGDAMAIAEAHQGTDIWGKKLGWIDYGFALMSAVSLVSAPGDMLKLAKTYPEQAAKLNKQMSQMRKMAGNMTAQELAMLPLIYPPRKVQMIVDLGGEKLSKKAKAVLGISNKLDEAASAKKMAGDGLPLILLGKNGAPDLKDITDMRDAKAMALMRDSIKEQADAKKIIDGLSKEERAAATAKVAAKMEESAPALNLERLADPSKMTDTDWNDLEKVVRAQFGPGNEAKVERRMKAFKGKPELVPGYVEKSTGIPIETLKVMGGALESKNFITYRLSNPESLRLQKRIPDNDFLGVATKHKDIKGKSGTGGLIPVDQEFSKMAQALEKAIEKGDTAREAKIRAEMAESTAGVQKIIERGVAKTSTTLEGRDIIAVKRKYKGKTQTTMVTRGKKGKMFDIVTGRPIEPKNITVITDKSGEAKKVPILVDNDGKVYVADADPHIWGVKDSGSLVDDTRVDGLMSRAEEASRLRQTTALSRAGRTNVTQHGSQSRALMINLDVDNSFYAMEAGGKIRFLKQTELADHVHYQRLNGTNAALDPRWKEFKGYTKDGFAKVEDVK